MVSRRKSVLYCCGEINDQMAMEVIMALQPGGVQTMVLNSPGGEIEAALAMFDAITAAGIDVVASGRCYSSALLVLQAGVKRIAFPNAQFLLHELDFDPNNPVERAQGTYLRFKVLEIFHKRSDLKVDELERLMKGVTYMHAPSAWNLGFIDSILKPGNDLVPSLQAQPILPSQVQ